MCCHRVTDNGSQLAAAPFVRGLLARWKALRQGAVRHRRSPFLSFFDRFLVLYWINKDLSSDEARYYADWVRSGRKRPLPLGSGKSVSRVHLGVAAGSRVWVPLRPGTSRSTEEILRDLKRLLESIGPNSSNSR